MEGEPKENGLVAEIKCILFCEFDPVAGPKITFQVGSKHLDANIG